MNSIKIVHMHNSITVVTYYGLYSLGLDYLCLYTVTGFMAHAYFTKVIFLHLWLSISWWPAGDYWVKLKYTWDFITEVGEYDILLNILKKFVAGCLTFVSQNRKVRLQ